jgi:hypothetical protein
MEKDSEDRTGMGMNITVNSQNYNMDNLIENYVGNSYLSDIKPNTSELNKLKVSLTR